MWDKLCDLLPVAATEFVDKEALGRSEKLREVDGKGGSEMLAVWWSGKNPCKNRLLEQ
jgi:hypothetical protein